MFNTFQRNDEIKELDIPIDNPENKSLSIEVYRFIQILYFKENKEMRIRKSSAF